MCCRFGNALAPISSGSPMKLRRQQSCVSSGCGAVTLACQYRGVAVHASVVLLPVHYSTHPRHGRVVTAPLSQRGER